MNQPDEITALKNEIAELKSQNEALRHANQAWAHEASRLKALTSPATQEALSLLLKAASLLSPR